MGRYSKGTFRRAAPAFNGFWTDLSYAGGIPIANYYASTPLEWVSLVPKEGILHPFNDSYLHKMMMVAVGTSNTPCTMHLIDYVATAPFIDFDNTDEQVFTGSVTIPDGCRAYIVSQGAGTGNTLITVNYTNQSGVSGRLSTQTITTLSNAGCLFTSGQVVSNMQGLFLRLEAGDSYMKSIESITVTTASGGIGALVICKPIGTIHLRELGVPVEIDFIKDKTTLPFVRKDAYLNFIGFNGASATPNIIGEVDFIW